MQDLIARQTSAMAQYTRALGLYQQRIGKIGQKGRAIVGTVYDPRHGLHFVGGKRNPTAAIPASTRAGILSALRSGVRAEKTLVEQSR